MNEMLATMAVEEMMKESIGPDLAKPGSGKMQPEPEPEPETVKPKPGQPTKQPKKRAKRRARPKAEAASAKDKLKAAAASAAGGDSPGGGADAETPRFRRPHDAPEQDTPRSPGGQGLAAFVGDIEQAGLLPPPEDPKKGLARGDSMGSEGDKNDSIQDVVSASPNALIQSTGNLSECSRN